jgi:hypothetical protein
MTPKDLMNLMFESNKSPDAEMKAMNAFKEHFPAYSDEQKKEIIGRLAINEYCSMIVNKTQTFIGKASEMVPGTILISELGSLYSTMILMVSLSQLMAKQQAHLPMDKMDFSKLDKAFPNGDSLFSLGEELFTAIQPMFNERLQSILDTVDNG